MMDLESLLAVKLAGGGGGGSGGLTMDLLWQNASPYSVFTGQDISITGLQGYTMLYIIAISGSQYSIHTSGILAIKDALNHKFNITQSTIDANNTYLRFRFATLNEAQQKITISACTESVIRTSGSVENSTDNGVLRAYKIYGIK